MVVTFRIDIYLRGGMHLHMVSIQWGLKLREFASSLYYRMWVRWRGSKNPKICGHQMSWDRELSGQGLTSNLASPLIHSESCLMRCMTLVWSTSQSRYTCCIIISRTSWTRQNRHCSMLIHQVPCNFFPPQIKN